MKYTLALDVYGTLIDTSAVLQTLVNLIGDKALVFSNTWRDKQLEYSFRRGQMDLFVDFSVCTKDALEYTCLLHNVDLETDQKTSLMQSYTVLPAFPDVEEALQNLKKDGHRLFAFSNGSKSAVRNLLINSKIIDHFDGVVSVETIGTFKPSPKVYAHFNESTSSNKSDTWLISGNPFDVLGALNYGMHSAWVRRSPSAIFDPWGIEPSTIVKDLNALPAALAEM